jgi:uncharacterized membrane protein
MTDPGLVVLGIPIPSSSKVFLAVVGVHVLVALACVGSGVVAMLSTKGSRRHIAAGAVYYWSLVVVVASTAVLSTTRWPDDNHLLVLGILSLGSAVTGRAASRHQWKRWPSIHILGMGVSYIVLLTAFYVDNGPNLPLWRDLPHITYWVGPAAVGLPILLYVLRFHALVKRASDR